MPVSFLPLVLPIVFLALLVRGAIRGKRTFLRAVAVVVATTAFLALPFYLPGWWLMLRASRGDGATLYKLARWHENHCDKLGAFILWPCSAGWTNAAGNVFPQPDKGQPLIDHALRAGYSPKIEERLFYWQEFRQ